MQANDAIKTRNNVKWSKYRKTNGRREILAIATLCAAWQLTIIYAEGFVAVKRLPRFITFGLL